MIQFQENAQTDRNITGQWGKKIKIKKVKKD